MKIWIEVYKDPEYEALYLQIKRPPKSAQSFEWLGEIGKECFHLRVEDAKDIYSFLTFSCDPIDTATLSNLYELEI